MTEQFENNYITLLNGSIDDNDTTITVDDVPVNMTADFRIKIEDEIILVGAVSGSTFTGCSRGEEGTTAASHADNTEVKHILTAEGLLSVGGGTTIQYGSLKPATPDDDFNSPTLTGWSANSQAGSFSLSHCFPQAVNGSYVSLGYDDRSGSIYKAQANTDLDFRVGGFSCEGNLHPSQGQKMPGIAVLDTNGDGVGLVFNSDLNLYLIEVDNYAFTGTSYGNVTNITPEYAIGSREYAFRITRVTNTWDGYLSMGGNDWAFHVSATGAKTITVDKIAIGTWKPNDGAARGRIYADWSDVT